MTYINQWWFYNQDKIRSIWSGDPKDDRKVVWVFAYFLVISVAWGYGVIKLDATVGYDPHLAVEKWLIAYPLFVAIYITVLIIGIKRILR